MIKQVLSVQHLPQSCAALGQLLPTPRPVTQGGARMPIIMEKAPRVPINR